MTVTKKDTRLVAAVLSDAEKLDWAPGQLDRRVSAVKGYFADKVSGGWIEESGLFSSVDSEDEFLRKHGWNKVDSGFRLWGGEEQADQKTDDFLESKGWNDVDSGFRLI